jgi:hypothetical protein
MADNKLNNLIDFKNYSEKEMNKPAKKTKRTETGKDIINEHHKETVPEKIQWICNVVNQLTDDDVNYLYDMIEDHISEGNIGNLEMLNEGLFTFDKKDIQKGLDSGQIAKTFDRAFKQSFEMGAVKKIADKLTDEQKKEFLDKALQDESGIGAIKLGKDGKLTYVANANVKKKGVGGGASGTSLK